MARNCEWVTRLSLDVDYVFLNWRAYHWPDCGCFGQAIHAWESPGGIWITMALGVAGSLVATYLGRTLGWYAADQSAVFLMSILGAMLLLLLYRVIRRRPARA